MVVLYWALTCRAALRRAAPLRSAGLLAHRQSADISLHQALQGTGGRQSRARLGWTQLDWLTRLDCTGLGLHHTGLGCTQLFYRALSYRAGPDWATLDQAESGLQGRSVPGWLKLGETTGKEGTPLHSPLPIPPSFSLSRLLSSTSHCSPAEEQNRPECTHPSVSWRKRETERKKVRILFFFSFSF